MQHERVDTATTLVGVSHERADTATTAISSPSTTVESSDEEFPVIPSTHPFRTLVLCFDGTGDSFDDDNSNVVQFFSLLKRNDPSAQLVYYQPGIGTMAIDKSFRSYVSSTIDIAVAHSLHDHVMGGYEFLMQNYQAGDRICIFGFSRGAYTARSLAGMIHKVGILPRCNHRQVPFAYDMYSQKHSDEEAQKFKASFSIDVDIEFLGVWDTVSSVGILPRFLPFTSSNSIIKTFRHAVALDEHRAKFKANLWHHDTPRHHQHGHKHKMSVDPIHQGFVTESRINELSGLEGIYAKPREKPTDVEEVWFAGSHTDVGGGSVKNGTRFGLARIPLRWMIRECFKAHSGIMFSTSGLRQLGLDPASLYDPTTGAYPTSPSTKLLTKRPDLFEVPKSLSTQAQPTKKPSSSPLPPSFSLAQIPDGVEGSSPFLIRTMQDDHAMYDTLKSVPILSEEFEEFYDALSPEYNQAYLNFWKWAWLEVIPLHSGRKRTGERLEVHWWRPRKIPRSHWIDGVHGQIKVHRSVKLRMEATLKGGYTPGEKYQPRVELDLEKVIWID